MLYYVCSHNLTNCTYKASQCFGLLQFSVYTQPCNSQLNGGQSGLMRGSWTVYSAILCTKTVLYIVHCNASPSATLLEYFGPLTNYGLWLTTFKFQLTAYKFQLTADKL